MVDKEKKIVIIKLVMIPIIKKGAVYGTEA